MNIIETIKAEIERQRKEIRPTNTGEMKVTDTPTQLEQGWLNALSWMEKVLDTLQEQPVKTNIVEDLKHYLATTPKEQIEKDWESLKEWGKVGPSVSEFLGWEKPVYEDAYIKRLHEKRILPTLKGEIKHKFRNEYNTILQTLGLIPLLNPYDVARKRLEEMCLVFASWGFYNLHLERCEHYPDVPVCEDLEEEENIFANKDLNKEWKKFIEQEKKENHGDLPCYGDFGVLRIACHFAKWGAEHASGSSEIPNDQWSENDEEMLNSAIGFVEHSAFTTIGKGKKNVLAWLKSLHLKVKSEIPTNLDEDIITIHLGKVLPEEQYNEVVRSVVAFMNKRWPGLLSNQFAN